MATGGGTTLRSLAAGAACDPVSGSEVPPEKTIGENIAGCCGASTKAQREEGRGATGGEGRQGRKGGPAVRAYSKRKQSRRPTSSAPPVLDAQLITPPNPASIGVHDIIDGIAGVPGV